MKNKKGFTLVELLVVIAILGILATVSIIGYTNLNDKAKYAKDQSHVKQWNTLLAGEVFDDNGYNINNVKDIINAQSLIPETKNMHFYWYESNNTIYLVDDNNSFKTSFPENSEIDSLYLSNASKFYRLDKTYYQIILNLNNCSCSNMVDCLEKGQSIDLKIVPDDGFVLVETINSSIENYSWDSTTAILSINNIQSNAEFIIETEACLAKGTKIVMADYSLKNIEDIVVGDFVLSFNHETASFESQRVYFAWASTTKAKSFSLNFSNGQSLNIIGEHCLFCEETLNYVTIFESDAEEYIGYHFYSYQESSYVELTSVTYNEEKVEFYDIYTECNYNCITDGILSLPHDVLFLVNFYTFNHDLSADLEVLSEDILEYGLFEYNSESVYSKEFFDTTNYKYINIIVGKGLITREEADRLRDSFLYLYY